MAQQYSQELIEEIKELVTERMDELKAMDRETLSAEYLKVVGVEAHPRMHLDMMAKMIARFHQGDLWNQKTGDIPPQIREKDMKFWLKMEAYFVPKAALKEEQAQPIASQAKKKKPQLGPKGLPGSRGTGLQSKAKNIEDSTVVLMESPTKTMLENYKDGEIQKTDELEAMLIIVGKAEDRTSMPYQEFAKLCKKKKLTKPPHMLALLMKRQGLVDLEYPEDETPPPPPPQEEEEESMTFTEVLDGVEVSKPELVVEPECVDFGTDEKVSDYD